MPPIKIPGSPPTAGTSSSRRRAAATTSSTRRGADRLARSVDCRLARGSPVVEDAQRVTASKLLGSRVPVAFRQRLFQPWEGGRAADLRKRRLDEAVEIGADRDVVGRASDGHDGVDLTEDDLERVGERFGAGAADAI